MSRVTNSSGALAGSEVNIFDKFSESAKMEWKDRVIECGGRIPDPVIETTEMFAENRQWIRNALEAGHTS